MIVYQGRSLLTGDPIVAIVTGLGHVASKNSKTGDMAQAWILRSDMDPSAAVKTGADEAICGHCQHRSGSNVGRSCYVIWWQAPFNIYKKFKADKYQHVTLPTAIDDRMLGHYVRLGAYGDPAAVPYETWLNVVRCSSGSIGYTQQWRTCDQRLSRLCMASVQSPLEADQAHALGWRTFRVRQPYGLVREDESICPASNEAGHRSTCRECLLCAGSVKQARSIVIESHGLRVKWFKEPPTP